MRLAVLATCALSLAACMFWGGVSADSTANIHSDAIAYTSTPNYDADAWLHGQERFPAGAQVKIRTGKVERPIVSGFATTADPAVSFDGMRILFAGKRGPKDSWQIWEVAATGGEARHVTTGNGDCVRPFYLPGARLVYARKSGHRYLIETAALDGGTVLALTDIPGSALPTDVLRDGRVLFQSAYPLGSESSTEIYTVYTDGSGVESYRCDHVNNRTAGKQNLTGDVVFRTVRGLGRFTSPLAHEVDMNPPAGEFAGDALETPSGTYLVSWRPDAKTMYSLQIWDSRANSLEPLVAATDANIVQPVLIASRAIPNQHPSGLHDWNYANLLCLNAYTSKYRFADGSIKSIRLYTANESGKPRLLGGSNVEPDGSFYLRVPADQPLQIELLDGSGKTLKREQGWFWMRRGEQRICVGCHAGPERAPENRVPAVLVKTTVPIDLTHSNGKPLQGGR